MATIIINHWSSDNDQQSSVKHRQRLTKAMDKIMTTATMVSRLKPGQSLCPNTVKYLLGIRPT